MQQCGSLPRMLIVDALLKVFNRQGGVCFCVLSTQNGSEDSTPQPVPSRMNVRRQYSEQHENIREQVQVYSFLGFFF